MQTQRTPSRFAAVAGVVTLAGLYWLPFRGWFRHWGATPEEVARPMAGDALIADPTLEETAAVTVDAPPDDIWPWLVQIGYQRGGLYSYDWLDRLFGILDRPSATRILPELQQLSLGDRISFGREGPTRQELTVSVLEPPRALALSARAGGMDWVWQWGLYPIDDERTRLVARSTERVPGNPLWWLALQITDPAAFVMGRKMLLNLKDRAEKLHAERRSELDRSAAVAQAEASVGGPAPR
ncbi:MAG TPA: SRPBCC family protein [Gaiellaceae bacterium]|nr:SRPBCC family protein [Gaiellaceae bacterium]